MSQVKWALFLCFISLVSLMGCGSAGLTGSDPQLSGQGDNQTPVDTGETLTPTDSGAQSQDQNPVSEVGDFIPGTYKFDLKGKAQTWAGVGLGVPSLSTMFQYGFPFGDCRFVFDSAGVLTAVEQKYGFGYPEVLEITGSKISPDRDLWTLIYETQTTIPPAIGTIVNPTPEQLEPSIMTSRGYIKFRDSSLAIDGDNVTFHLVYDLSEESTTTKTNSVLNTDKNGISGDVTYQGKISPKMHMIQFDTFSGTLNSDIPVYSVNGWGGGVASSDPAKMTTSFNMEEMNGNTIVTWMLWDVSE